jgi:hypothetical protein
VSTDLKAVSEPYWTLVTGSRYFAGLDTIVRTLQEIASEHPGRPLGLMHGMCDPRHPLVHERVIPWRSAEKLSLADRKDLLGADWLADLAAQELGWHIERRPADWESPCRPECKPGHRRTRSGKTFCPAAGNYRNGGMVQDMVAIGAPSGNGECAPFAGLCLSARCRIARPHESHGTADCIRRAREAQIPVRPFPAET